MSWSFSMSGGAGAGGEGLEEERGEPPRGEEEARR